MKKILFILFVLIPCKVIGEIVVPMEKQENGLYLIPCKVNGVPMKFIFDTGASTVNISMTEALFLYKNGHIQESDIKGTSHAQIANGEIVENTRILLHKIDIGGIEINDVDATVSHNLNAPLLLGQSAINRLGMIQLDGTNLIIKEPKNIEGQNDNISILFHFSIIVLIIAIVGYLIYIVFSKFKRHNYALKTAVLGSTISNSNSHLRIKFILIWLKRRKYIIYTAYSLTLLLSILIVELHINNKREILFTEMFEQMKSSVCDPNGKDWVEALDNENVDELEYAEVPIPSFAEKDFKGKKKQWNNMFSGIEHVYKITDGGWQMIGMSFQPVRYSNLLYKDGIQDFFYTPYMICVPEGIDFNPDIAKRIVEKSLDKVYRDPDNFNLSKKVLEQSNDYFHMVGHFADDSIPEPINFYNETTGTNPIFENGKFTGGYWFGMHKIGPYRVLLRYTNRLAWNLVEKEGFNASIKDRAIGYGITFILLTTFFLLFLYCVNHSSRKGTDINAKYQLYNERND